MQCPKCGLTNPDSAQRCDCGHSFDASIPPTNPKLIRYELREIDASRAAMIAGISTAIYCAIQYYGEGIDLF